MKIAITSTGNSLDSMLDKRFGRCSYFAILDTETKDVEFIANPNKEIDEGAGPASVQLIASAQAETIVSAEFGYKIKSLLNELKIQMIIAKDPELSVRDIVKQLNQ
ncbi:MAG: NifB/NifX family molybdenum-iron cluster-binding protein [Bacteroidales bacterium]|nr:NifB/NifX family molybdenum-iron cluster-binding protein [Bacteroidales bacterium]MDD4822737.1 NifB/NifX family molybdenum-iron cluster-binding protein [Bacteroidales bacterium]